MPQLNKRLDTLAKVLECESMCVAVTCVDSKFIIAANEFHAGTKLQEGHPQIIINIMEYLQKIANDGIVETEERDTLLKKIYDRRFRHKDLYVHKATNPEEKEQILSCITSLKLATESFTESGKSIKQPEIRAKASSAYNEMLRIYKSLKRLEDGIIGRRQGKENASVTEEQLTAFKSFTSDCIYVEEQRKERKAGKTKKRESTHAEMQLLSYLLDKGVNKQVYLGISKDSCLDCHCMFEAANEVLTTRGSSLYIDHKGNHDGKFSDNWFLPDIFENSVEPIYTEILEECERQKTQIKEAPRYYQYHEDSDTSVSSEIEIKKDKYYQELDAKQKCFEEGRECNPRLSPEENLKFINLGKALVECSLFERLYTTETEQQDISSTSTAAEQQVLQTNVEMFITKIITEHGEIEIEILNKFFQSPYFPKNVPNIGENVICKMSLETLEKHKATKLSSPLEPLGEQYRKQQKESGTKRPRDREDKEVTEPEQGGQTEEGQKDPKSSKHLFGSSPS